MYVSLESLDAGGKGTIVDRLKKIFEMTNRPHITTREPGGTNVGEAIRNILLSNDLDNRARINLFLVSRKLNLEQVVKPALNSRKLVIGERSNSSTIVFQGYVPFYLNKEDITIFEYIKEAFDFHGIDVIPDLSIYIDVDEDERQKRISRREFKDVFEDVDPDYIEGLKAGYKGVFIDKLFPWASKEFAVVTSTTPHDTTEQVLKTMNKHGILSDNDLNHCLKANDLIGHTVK